MMPSNVSEVYFDQYQRDSVCPDALLAYSDIAKELSGMFAPRTAMDIGSGGGALVRGLLQHSVEAYGVEGSLHAVNLLPDRIYYHDLREPWGHKNKYDLITCFDVAEHIEPDYVETFCNNIYLVSHRSSTLVFGAAPEGQDGLGHVNCQHPTYWLWKLGKKWQVDPVQSEVLRVLIKSRPSTAFLWWVSKNLMVLRRV